MERRRDHGRGGQRDDVSLHRENGVPRDELGSEQHWEHGQLPREGSRDKASEQGTERSNEHAASSVCMLRAGQVRGGT